MSPRSRPTFAKRQKERARQEKRLAKAERKQQRKLEKLTDNPGDDSTEPGNPVMPEEDSHASE